MHNDPKMADKQGTKKASQGGPSKANGRKAYERKPVRKASARYLKNAGLYYVQRYAATQKRLRTVLMRKVDRSIEAHGGDRAELAEIVDGLVEEFVRLSYVDDSRFSLSKARRLHRSGNSRRQIAAKLGVDGVAREVVNQALAALEADLGESSEALERTAAWSFARKKRLGPYRDPAVRQDFWKKDVGALARRGFSADLSYKIVDAEEIPDEFYSPFAGGLS